MPVVLPYQWYDTMGFGLNFLAVTTSESNAVEYGQCPLESKDVLGIANLNAYTLFKGRLSDA